MQKTVMSRGLPERRSPFQTASSKFARAQGLAYKCNEVGWSLDCHQLDKGEFKGEAFCGLIAGLHVLRLQANRRIELLGRAPDNHLILIVPVAGSELWANGFRIDGDEVLLVLPDANLHLVGNMPFFYVAQLPFALLRGLEPGVMDKQTLDCRDGTLTVRHNAVDSAKLQWALSRVVSPMTTSQAIVDKVDDCLKDELVSYALTVSRLASDQQRRFGMPRSEAWRTISRARDFVEGHLHSPIRMKHVSDYAAASISKLERTFQRELSVTPSRYILTRRLNAVRLDLDSATSRDVKISDLAMQYGFRHLGRFSAAYRAHFGELPSQTLQRQEAQASGGSRVN